MTGGLVDCRRLVTNEEPDERVVQVRLVDRLAEIRIEQPIAVAELAPAERAEQHQRQRGAPLADLSCEREPVHLRHVHVEHGDVERIALVDPAQRFGRRLGRARLHPPFRRLQREEAAIRLVVVDDQQPLAFQPWLHADEIAGSRRGRARPSAR